MVGRIKRPMMMPFSSFVTLSEHVKNFDVAVVFDVMFDINIFSNFSLT